ncbi:MAG: DUF1993 domain-containing protein [Deltaproteobacteria bacterium]|nr:DUF1993 domain-containing protein [Deltaproteobacteria bacterium]
MLFEMTVPQYIKMLKNLSAILDKGAAYAASKKFDTEVLLQARLAPDQFPFVRQIQIACDTAKLGTSRLTGKEAPSNDDKEKTWDEIKNRVQTTIAYLEKFSAADFKGAEDKKISQPRWEGKWLNGNEYVHEHALPNFYFHITTAYAILRKNGVDVGKKDYLGPLPYKN